MPYGYYYGFDYTWYLLVLPALLFTLWAQLRVKSTYRKYSGITCARGRSADAIARQILNEHGLGHVRIEPTGGSLTDHYDPAANVVRLSQGVYGSSSIAAIGVAAHEVGHAIQHAEGYGPMKLRSVVIPVTNFGAKLAMPLFLAGLLFNFTLLMELGILLFSLVTVFQLITLPVEFNASRRAIATIEARDLLTDDELQGARRVLNAAALTYVAALASSLAQLLRLVMISRGGNRRR